MSGAADARSGRVALAVREIHQPIEALNVRYGQKQQVCTGCGTDDGNWQLYPCPTIRAVARAEKGAGDEYPTLDALRELLAEAWREGMQAQSPEYAVNPYETLLHDARITAALGSVE